VVADSGSEAGHVISTTIRGRNGLPKQVKATPHSSSQSVMFGCEAKFADMVVNATVRQLHR
jgi:hypothetical protein